MTSLTVQFKRKAGLRYGKARVEGLGFHDLITRAESISLSDEDILRICEGKVNIYLYEDLAKFDSIDEALGEHTSMIILYQAKQDFGHWVSVFKVDDNTLEFWDSYGFKLDQELPFFPYNLRQGIPHLTHLIQNSNYNLITNQIDFQTVRSDVQTCGRYASLRIRMRKTPLHKFQALLLNNPNDNPDYIVSALTIIFSL